MQRQCCHVKTNTSIVTNSHSKSHFMTLLPFIYNSFNISDCTWSSKGLRNIIIFNTCCFSGVWHWAKLPIKLNIICSLMKFLRIKGFILWKQSCLTPQKSLWSTQEKVSTSTFPESAETDSSNMFKGHV